MDSSRELPADQAVEPSISATLFQLAAQAADWVNRHQGEIAAFHEWLLVARACEITRLYAPVSPAWPEIARAVEAGADADDLKEVLLRAHGPRGAGYEALSTELRSAPLLKGRRQEVDEVLASLADERNYVTICGALPLVEGLLAQAHGKWKKRLTDYPIEARLDQPGGLTTEEEAELLINKSAVEMVIEGIPEVWKSERMRAGAQTTELNRNWALHGTARGWHTPENATQSVLLVAAAARVAQPLLSPKV
jgi:hypothetical protein